MEKKYSPPLFYLKTNTYDAYKSNFIKIAQKMLTWTFKCKHGFLIGQSDFSLKVANCIAYKSYLPHLTGLRDEKRDEAELSLDLLLPGVAEPDLEADPPGVEVVGPPGVDTADPRQRYS